MDELYFTHLVTVGACYIDTILTVPTYPSEDAKQRASALSKRRGGNCPNTVEVLQQLLAQNYTHQSHDEKNIPPELILLSTLPAKSSPDTKFIVDSFNARNDTILSPVNLNHIFHRSGVDTAASSYIVQSKANNSRTIVNYNALDEMTFSEFRNAISSILTRPTGTTTSDYPSKKKKVWIHFEGRIPETTLQCITWLREMSSPSSESDVAMSGDTLEAIISVECEKPQRAGLEDLAEHANVVFYSRSWAEGQGYTTAEECLMGEADRIRRKKQRSWDMNGDVVLCCPWGEMGASALQFSIEKDTENRIVTKPPWAPESSVLKVVDTIGAGDTWIAGMLYGFIQRSSWDIGQKVEFANELAARKTSRSGFDGLGFEMKEHMRS